MKKIIYLFYALLFSSTLSAQGPKEKDKNSNQLIDFAVGLGSAQANITGSYIHNWTVDKHKKWTIGLGARFTSGFATDKYYKTAKAKLTSGKTGPGVLFADDIPANIDSFFIGKTQINSLNLTFNTEYEFNKKLSVGFNIDLVGFSFGAAKKGIYINNGNTALVDAKPTGFNLLLVSDNDLGSLNSELFIRYKLNPKWSLRAGTSFLFGEYTTNTEVQNVNGIKNDRFRYKSLYGIIALSYHF